MAISSRSQPSPYRIFASVGEVELRLFALERHSGPFRHHLHVDRLSWLHANYQLIPVNVGIAEDVAANVAKLDPYLGFALV